MATVTLDRELQALVARAQEILRDFDLTDEVAHGQDIGEIDVFVRRVAALAAPPAEDGGPKMITAILHPVRERPPFLWGDDEPSAQAPPASDPLTCAHGVYLRMDCPACESPASDPPGLVALVRRLAEVFWDLQFAPDCWCGGIDKHSDACRAARAITGDIQRAYDLSAPASPQAETKGDESPMPRYALSTADLDDLLRLRGLRLTREADRQRQVLRAAGKPGPCVPLPSVRHSFPAIVRRFISKESRG